MGTHPHNKIILQLLFSNIIKKNIEIPSQCILNGILNDIKNLIGLLEFREML